MSDAPERIWAYTSPSGDVIATQTLFPSEPMSMTGYVREDLYKKLEDELWSYRYEVVEKAVANEADALDLWKASQEENARLREALKETGK